MSAQIYKINGEELCSFSLQAANLSLRAGGPDELVLEFGADYGSTPAFDYNDVLTLTAHDPTPDSSDQVTLFKGRVTSPRIVKRQPDQGYTIVAVNGWGDMEGITLESTIKSYNPVSQALDTITTARVLLGQASDGSLQTTGETLEEIIDFAITKNAILSKGTILTGRTVSTTQVIDTGAADALRQYLGHHPDAVAWMESGDELNIKLVSDLDEVSLDPNCGQFLWDAVERVDRAPVGVKIIWEITHQVDGNPRVERQVDQAGESTGWPPPLVQTIELAGANTTYLKEEMETRSIPTGAELDSDLAKNFYKGLYPQLADADNADLKISGQSLTLIDPRLNDLSEDGSQTANPNSKPFDNSPVPADFPNQLVKGEVKEWMSPLQQHEALLKATITYQGSDEGVRETVGAGLIVSEPITITDALSKEYSEIDSVTDGQSPIAGAAAAYWNAVKTPQFEGTFSGAFRYSDLSLRPGRKLTITGVTNRASKITELSLDLIQNSGQGKFGINEYLTPAEIHNLRANQNLNAPTYSTPEERTEAKAPIGKKPINQGTKPLLKYGTLGGGGSVPKLWGMQVVNPETPSVKIINPGTVSKTDDADDTGEVSLSGLFNVETTVSAGKYINLIIDKDLVATVASESTWTNFPDPIERTTSNGFEIFEKLRIRLYKIIETPATLNTATDTVINETLVARKLWGDSHINLLETLREFSNKKSAIVLVPMPGMGYA